MARPKPDSVAGLPAPLTPSPTKQFERDVKRMMKRKADFAKFKGVIFVLCSCEPLPLELKDHPLKGMWTGSRDCHVTPDWIIIYRKTDTELILERTGTHLDLFR